MTKAQRLAQHISPGGLTADHVHNAKLMQSVIDEVLLHVENELNRKWRRPASSRFVRRIKQKLEE